MLKLLFDALDRHPFAYWLIVAAPTVALIGIVVSTIFSRRGADDRRTDWLFAGILVGFLFAWRWPFFFDAREFNPDESQLIAGAATLAHDSVFWRSVDGTTSGPLNFYVLVPLHFLGLPLDYFTARFTGLLLVSFALLCCYRLFRSFAPPVAAQLAVLPAVVFFATTVDGNFIHYSSEHVSLGLLGLASFGLLRSQEKERQSEAGMIWGGIAAGLLPWAKLQTAPLGAALIAWKLWTIYADPDSSRPTKWRRARHLLMAVVGPSIVAIIAITATGQFEHFIRNYLLQNLVYVGEGTTLAITISELAEFTSTTWSFPVYLGVSVAIVLFTGVIYWRIRRLPHALFIAGSILTLAAAICVLAPRRPFAHYLLLAIVPLACWSGAAISDLWHHVPQRRRFAVTLLIIGCFLPLGVRFAQPQPDIFHRLPESWRRPHSIAGTILRAYTEPGDYLGVWGWRTDVYVDSGLIQATRDPHSVWSIVNTPYRAYHRARYLADLTRNQPVVFLDSVGPGAFAYHTRSEHGHEAFPELAAYIGKNYALLVDLGMERIYLRHDYAGDQPREVSGSILQEYVRQSRREPEMDAPPPDSIEPSDTSGWDIEGRGVRTLQPPGRMTWVLKGDEREISIEYGFHPRAYTEGTTNGAEIVLELHADGHPPREVFRRYLRPVSQPADRGTQTTLVTLPPFSPGTKWIVRAEAGEFNDAAWDWVYVGRVRFLRSPAFLADQFPEFHRLPNRVQAHRSMLRKKNGRYSLELNAPTELTYVLNGNERVLTFSFGIEGKTFTGPDGATFRAELHRENGETEVLFEYILHPRTRPAERERQWAKIALPAAHPGDELVLRISEKVTDAARTAYLTDLVLK